MKTAETPRKGECNGPFCPISIAERDRNKRRSAFRPLFILFPFFLSILIIENKDYLRFFYIYIYFFLFDLLKIIIFILYSMNEMERERKK